MSRVSTVFQSTPLAEARGDEDYPEAVRFDHVSIHSPRRSEGRLTTFGTVIGALLFQSTPLAEARGDQEGGGCP